MKTQPTSTTETQTDKARSIDSKVIIFDYEIERIVGAITNLDLNEDREIEKEYGKTLE